MEARIAGLADAAHAAGLLHDLGKYRPEFQLMLEGKHARNEKTYHKQAGAAYVCQLASPRFDIAFAIAGHHGGIPDRADLISAVNGPSGKPLLSELTPNASADLPELVTGIPPADPRQDRLSFDLATRLLFSCLVDADWADTSEHERKVLGLPAEPDAPQLHPDRMLAAVLAYIRQRSEACPDRRIAEIRSEVLEAALKAAEALPGLFDMTVPTGGGKTLSGLAFALAHAAKHKLHRIIYVAPYLSILEQNAREIRRALAIEEDSPFVFEHHSLAEPAGGGSNDPESSAAARRAESWEAPVVVTTNVQFFESLFSNRPGQCRKLHNIARSVVILDECQTLPPDLVAPTCGMLRQLAEACSCTIVLCTATQPAFSHPELKPAERLVTRPVVPKELDLFRRLKRVSLLWPRDSEEAMTWTQVAARMSQEPGAMAVVNTRRAARELFAELKQHVSSSHLFHLSTTMCPAHRLAVLDVIKRFLRDKQRCFLVSTQLIEAGVDVDFPFVMRELAPLEAIIQAAGRCNREGMLNSPDGSPGGRAVVFRSAASIQEPRKYYPPDRWYKAGRSVLETSFLNAGRLPRIDEPEDVAEYFTRLYRTGDLDTNMIQAKRAELKFAEVASDYRIISDDGVPLVVASWQERQEEIESLLNTVRVKPTRANFRKLAPFQINLRRYELAKLGPSIARVDPRFDLFRWDGTYDSCTGIIEGGNDLLLV